LARIAMGPWVVRYGQARIMADHREEAGWTCGGCRTPAGFRACRRLRAGGCVRAVACGRVRAGAVIARSADGRNPGWRGEEMARYGGEYRAPRRPGRRWASRGGVGGPWASRGRERGGERGPWASRRGEGGEWASRGEDVEWKPSAAAGRPRRWAAERGQRGPRGRTPRGVERPGRPAARRGYRMERAALADDMPDFELQSRLGMRDFMEGYGRYSGGSPYAYEYSERTIQHQHPHPAHMVGFTRPLRAESARRFPPYGRGAERRRRWRERAGYGSVRGYEVEMG